MAPHQLSGALLCALPSPHPSLAPSTCTEQQNPQTVKRLTLSPCKAAAAREEGGAVLDSVSHERAVAAGQTGRSPVLGDTRPGVSVFLCRGGLPQGWLQGGTGPRPQPVFTALLFGCLGSACTELLARWEYRFVPFCFLL